MFVNAFAEAGPSDVARKGLRPAWIRLLPVTGPARRRRKNGIGTRRICERRCSRLAAMPFILLTGQGHPPRPARRSRPQRRASPAVSFAEREFQVGSVSGPRTQRGRARASRNAHRHGLSVSVVSDPRLSQRVEDLARDIVGETASPSVLEMARRFAEAQIDLDRICRVRYQVCWLPPDPGTGSEPGASVVEPIVRNCVRQLKSLDRYERRALSRRRSAARAFDAAFFEAAALRGFPE